ncbi:MAG: hypothetical protein AB4057_20290 [Crocosphaera sp.]
MSNLLSLMNKSGVKLFLVGSITLIIIVLIAAKTNMILNLKFSDDGFTFIIDSRSNQEF